MSTSGRGGGRSKRGLGPAACEKFVYLATRNLLLHLFSILDDQPLVFLRLAATIKLMTWSGNRSGRRPQNSSSGRGATHIFLGAFSLSGCLNLRIVDTNRRRTLAELLQTVLFSHEEIG